MNLMRKKILSKTEQLRFMLLNLIGFLTKMKDKDSLKHLQIQMILSYLILKLLQSSFSSFGESIFSEFLFTSSFRILFYSYFSH